MQDVEMTVDSLKEILERNRGYHVAKYETAFGRWQRAFMDAWEAVTATLRTHAPGEVDCQAPFRLVMPVNHVEDYDTALEMLGHEQRQVLILSDHEYRQYVQDNWGWKQQFTTANASYGVE